MLDTHLPLHRVPTASERLFPTLTAAQMARISALASAVGEGSIAIAFVHQVLQH